MKRKRRDPRTKRRERDFNNVDCPTQQKTYCNPYHKIDKGNGAEAKYNTSKLKIASAWLATKTSRPLFQYELQQYLESICFFLL